MVPTDRRIKMDAATLNKAIEMLNSAAALAVDQYVGWTMLSAIVGVIVGLCFFIGAYKIRFDADSEIAPWGRYLIKGLIVFVGLTFVGCNISDIFFPKAAAIHQLLRDVRGSDKH